MKHPTRITFVAVFAVIGALAVAAAAAASRAAGGTPTALAGTAGATKPFKERQVQGPFTLGAGETCSFAVLVQPTAPDVSNFFVFSDGEIFGAGPFVGTATNLDTGKTVKINLSGHFSVVQHSDGTTTITSDGFVLSTLFGTIFSGHGVIVLDASGNVVSRTFNGTERDLCAELAEP